MRSTATESSPLTTVTSPEKRDEKSESTAARRSGYGCRLCGTGTRGGAGEPPQGLPLASSASHLPLGPLIRPTLGSNTYQQAGKTVTASRSHWIGLFISGERTTGIGTIMSALQLRLAIRGQDARAERNARRETRERNGRHDCSAPIRAARRLPPRCRPRHA